MSTRSTDAGLRPHSGARREHAPGAVRDAYGAERSGTIEYRFNAHGYRGEELDPAAERRIVVCGCSHTLGVGVAWEDTWGVQLRNAYAKHAGLAPERVNLVNLAQGGSSNDYVSRTLVGQLSRIDADLVAVLFTHAERAERRDGGRFYNLGPWDLERAMELSEDIDDLPPVLQLARLWFSLTSEEQAVLDTLKNILLVQSVCAARRIPFVWGWLDHAWLQDPLAGESPALAPLVDALDLRGFAPFDAGAIQREPTIDGEHFGPRSHRTLARRLLDAALRVLPSAETAA